MSENITLIQTSFPGGNKGKDWNVDLQIESYDKEERLGVYLRPI